MQAVVRRFLPVVAAAGAFVIGAVPAQAQNFPSKPIRIIVPLGAGSSTDLMGRLVGQGISDETGQTVLVENRVGAEGAIGSRFVASAAPDGYTLMVTTSSTQVLNVHLYKSLPYDPVKDFEAVAPFMLLPLSMYVNAGSPYNSVADVVAAARKQAGKSTFGSSTATMRLSGEMFAQLAGVQLTNVPYKATAAALTDLTAGRLDFVITDAASAAPLIGKLKQLAIMANRRLDSVPQVPTIGEAGVANYSMTLFYGTWAPAGTPAPVVAKLNGVIAGVMKTPKVNELMRTIGGQPFHLSPEEFKKFVAAEIEKMGPLVRSSRIEVQ